MDAIRKQASKLRDQVAKQQVVLKQFSGRFSNDSVTIDDAEIRCYEQLKRLYSSTRSAKHFQKDLGRGVEDFIYASLKQMEVATKLADNCCRYGNKNENPDSALGRGSLCFGTSHKMMEKERENLHEILDAQVSEPLRTMMKGAPLEDARHLTHQYYRIKQEVEAQANEVIRRQLKLNKANATSDSEMKLQNAKSKLAALKSTMLAIGKEATTAMMAVEVQQQRLTFERLLAMVGAERSYHQQVAAILDELHAEMVLKTDDNEPISKPAATMTDVGDAFMSVDVTNSNESGGVEATTEKEMHFIAKAIHPFEAQAEGELTLSVGDYVVVRQIAASGWSEGECRGWTGWFPSAYTERCDMVPAGKIMETKAIHLT